MIRSYFYRVSGALCGEPQTIRHCSSRAFGRILNTKGENWQMMADVVQAIAILCGSIIKIELSQSVVGSSWLLFTIYYDRIDSGIKFFNLIQALSQIQQMNILDINYMEETSGDTHV